MMVGEVYILSTKRIAKYYGNGDELHMSFNFPPLHAPWEAAAWRRRIERVIEELDPRGAWPTWVISNHDNPRHRTRYGSEAKARAAAILLLTLRGTPFLYAGEELGLSDAVIPQHRVRDPGGRDGCRAPIPWTPEPTHGWSTDDPWLPWPPEAEVLNVETESYDPASMLHLYRRMLAERRASPALRLGAFSWLEAPEGVLAYERFAGDDRRVVLVNYTDQRQRVTAGAGLTADLTSDGLPFDDATMTPWQAVLLH
jgi:alpha-glucosidase